MFSKIAALAYIILLYEEARNFSLVHRTVLNWHPNQEACWLHFLLVFITQNTQIVTPSPFCQKRSHLRYYQGSWNSKHDNCIKADRRPLSIRNGDTVSGKKERIYGDTRSEKGSTPTCIQTTLLIKKKPQQPPFSLCFGLVSEKFEHDILIFLIFWMNNFLALYYPFREIRAALPG